MINNKRMIDAIALIDELKWLQVQVSSASAMEIQEYIDRIKKQPTVDAVEVVRCVKCKSWDPDSGYCQFWHGVRHPGNYCGEGKMKAQ